MKHLEELFLGLATSLATALIVLGAISISITEGMVFVPSPELKPTTSPLDFDLSTLLPEQTSVPTKAAANHLITATLPSVNICNYPKKWLPYTILIGDTLKALAKEFGVSQQELKEANCLVSDELVPGTEIYVPPFQPTSTPTAKPAATRTRVPTSASPRCVIPVGWIAYRIQPGENLFRIGLRYNVTAEELRRVNCLASSDRIIAGTIIYVPNVPTMMPTSTRTSVPPTRTPRPTHTTIPSTTAPAPTSTLVSPITPSATATLTDLPTATFTNIPTDTVMPSETSVPSTTETAIPTPTTPEP